MAAHAGLRASIAGEPFDKIAVHIHACCLQFPENVRHLRKWIKRKIERHQPVTEARFFEAYCFQREVERVTGDLPEVCVSPLGRAKPRILQLLVSPEGGESVDVLA